MKNFSVLLVLLAVTLFSCKDKELENRVTKLEGRLAVLESQVNLKMLSDNVGKPMKNTPKEPETKPEGPLPSIKFEEESFDFGKIQEGDVVEHVFSFVNNGEAPLVISQASATCGCTVPDWPKQPVKVGEKGKIKVVFNSKGKSGTQNKTVTVTANTWPTTNRVTIIADVNKK